LQTYETDDLDIAYLVDLPELEMDRARQRHPGEYISGPWLYTLNIGFDVSRPPFDERRVRRAFTLATDRHTLADVGPRGYYFPATGGLVPPGMPGHSPGIGLPYDPEGASQLMAEAGYRHARGFPVVDSLTWDDLPMVELCEWLQAQWLETLGIEITWDHMEWGRFCDKLAKEVPHMWIAGWRADYPDPDSFLRVAEWRLTTGWQNGVYEGLVEGARRVMDQAERMKMYQQADMILVKEAVILPLMYGRFHLLVKPWVRRYPMSPLRQEFWQDVIIEPH
jgi:oligopeptide transport system substrate-binding protein